MDRLKHETKNEAKFPVDTNRSVGYFVYCAKYVKGKKINKTSYH